jgi:hypothetical protein
MKMISEYLDHAITFERMAAEEDDPKLKAQFKKQAAAYRLAKTRGTIRHASAKSAGLDIKQ